MNKLFASILLITGSVFAMEAKEQLNNYRDYVLAEAEQFANKTQEFVTAIEKNDLELAKKLYAPARVHYERIEPIAGLFEELDGAIDARADDFKMAEKDPEFKGYHRLEYQIWVENKADKTVATELAQNVNNLVKEIKVIEFPLEDVVGGAAELIEEVALSKISGEENRYSFTDLSDFQANVDGSQKIIEIFSKDIAAKDEKLLNSINENFAKVNEILAKYKKEDGSFASYKELSDDDRTKLAVPINQLAEKLALVRGTLGLD